MDINAGRLLGDIEALGNTALNAEGKRVRLAASDGDREGRDLVVRLFEEAGLRVVVDRIGNIFGIWESEANCGEAPMMVGSHIDSVIDAGRYDGCLGVLASLEAVRTLKENGYATERPVMIGVFTNEEGVRYSPDMLGSLVYAGGMSCEEGLASVGIDGTVLKDELERIGYAGTAEPGSVKPYAFAELHIEQGPILDSEKIQIGAVQNLQGIYWQRITITGAANHAGTTPTALRRDAGLAAAKINVFAREMVKRSGGVATVGTIAFEPNAVNVIPSKAVFTLDLRNPDKEKLDNDKLILAEYLKQVAAEENVEISSERMSDFDPVPFDMGIVEIIERAAAGRNLSCRRMTSGAGQDAQMLARLCPTAMIFVPSVNGISHNPKEYTSDEDVVNGANILLDVVSETAGAHL